MAAGIQRSGLNESTYERPQQNWVCGWAAEGKPCRHGPNSKGVCVAAFECTPSERNGRWHCSRQQVHGGRCEDGPRPDGSCCKPIPKCQPGLSWRARRGKLTRWTLALTLGLIIVSIVWLGPTAVSPGPLNAKHSTAAKGCVSCHFSGHEPFSKWLAVALGTVSNTGESSLCTVCHDRGEHPFQPHSVDPELLAAWTKRTLASTNTAITPIRLSLSSIKVSAVELRERELECASCHVEHRGQSVDLKQMTNSQCQGCHSSRFRSFEQDHPEFYTFPYERRTRINFNHASHIDQHFSKKERTVFDCSGCHRPDAAGHQMLTRTFDKTCAECHANQIVADAQPVFVIPALDLESLEDREVDIGSWPEEGFEGISAPLRLMLSARSELRAALALVDEIEDLEDLSDEDEVTDEHLEAVATVAWSIKSLLAEIALGGHGTIAWYLEASLGMELPAKAVSELAGGLPQQTVLEMIDVWFPEIEDELEDHQAGLKVPTTAVALRSPMAKSFSVETRGLFRLSASGDWKFVKTGHTEQVNYLKRLFEQAPTVPDAELLEDPPEEADGQEDWSSGGGWYYSEDDYGMYYQVSGHQDPFSRAWLDIAAQLEPVQTGAFEMLADRGAAGRCTKCHSIDQEDDRLGVNWSPFTATTLRPVTQFSHEAHFSLGDQDGCLTCHDLTRSSQFAKGFEDYESGLVRIKLQSHDHRHLPPMPQRRASRQRLHDLPQLPCR